MQQLAWQRLIKVTIKKTFNKKICRYNNVFGKVYKEVSVQKIYFYVKEFKIFTYLYKKSVKCNTK